MMTCIMAKNKVISDFIMSWSALCIISCRLQKASQDKAEKPRRAKGKGDPQTLHLTA